MIVIVVVLTYCEDEQFYLKMDFEDPFVIDAVLERDVQLLYEMKD
jgi:hypothetical protein